MKNAEWMVQNGYKFSELRWSFTQPGIIRFYLNDKNIGKVSSSSIFEAIKTWLDAEHIEPILDDAEKQYLSVVIRPFRNDVKYIEKRLAGSGRCYILIKCDDVCDDFSLPAFSELEMYKGMKPYDKYTPEELGL